MNKRRLLNLVTKSNFGRQQGEVVPPDILARAASLVEDVRLDGDLALRRLAARFDSLEAGAPLWIDREQLDAAARSLPAEQRTLLERTAERIRRFAVAQRSCVTDLEMVQSGIRAGHRFLPVPTAGCYAPGGRFPLPSSVLMTVVTARVAGVQEVIVASPNPGPVMLAAASIAGATALVPAGGAHAIAALAFGTDQIPMCDIVVGPGNAWVTAAKQLIAGHTRIDSLAGPSELLIVIDASSDPATVAADLLAQAEHDVMAVPALLSLDRGSIERVEAELQSQLPQLQTADTARAALGNSMAVVADSIEEAIELCNRFAPEHLEWMAADRSVTDRLQHYGGLFIGAGAAEVLGDYGAGPNHVLPTGGSARSRGGLSVLDFLKVSTWMERDDTSTLTGLAEDAASLAELEGLHGHARAARRRCSMV